MGRETVRVPRYGEGSLLVLGDGEGDYWSARGWGGRVESQGMER